MPAGKDIPKNPQNRHKKKLPHRIFQNISPLSVRHRNEKPRTQTDVYKRQVLAIEQVEGSTLLDKLELDADKKYAIVMGNEVKGVQQEVVNACDGCIEIPQYGTKHSLNVSVTTGIIVWEFANKLMKFR